MNKLLKYLFPIILAAITFLGGTDDLESITSKSLFNEVVSETTSKSYDSFATESELYLPSQTSSANVFQLRSSAKRTNTIYKNYLGLIRTSKVVNTGIRNFIYKESLIVYSSFIKPFHRLISLGKLII